MMQHAGTQFRQWHQRFCFAHHEHFVEASSNEFVPEVDLEVDVLGGVDDGVDELETG